VIKKALLIVMWSSVSLEAMFVGRLFDDGKLRQLPMCKFVARLSCAIKLGEFVASLTWALERRDPQTGRDTYKQNPIPAVASAFALIALCSALFTRRSNKIIVSNNIVTSDNSFR